MSISPRRQVPGSKITAQVCRNLEAVWHPIICTDLGIDSVFYISDSESDSNANMNTMPPPTYPYSSQESDSQSPLGTSWSHSGMVTTPKTAYCKNAPMNAVPTNVLLRCRGRAASSSLEPIIQNRQLYLSRRTSIYSCRRSEKLIANRITGIYVWNYLLRPA